MAQSTDIAWEVRTGGAATNGGGFKFGASGTDWSQQTAAQYSVTDAVTNGTTTVTSATAAWGTDVVGNVMYLQGGTGSVAAGWYEIITRVSATEVTVDRSTGLTAGTGVTSKVGGCLNSINTLASAMQTAGQWAFVKADGTYTQTASPVFNISGTPSDTVMFSRISGYTTTRGDGGRANILLSTNSALEGFRLSNSGYFIENFDIDCASLTTSSGINSAGSGNAFYNMVRNVKVSNFKLYGIRPGIQYCSVHDCEVTGGLSGASAGIYSDSGAGVQIHRNRVHTNVCPGIFCGSAASILFNLVTGNTGASSDGISCSLYGLTIMYNTVHGNGRHGINLTSAFAIPSQIRGNLLSGHTAGGAAGIKFNGTGPVAAIPALDGNAFYNNTANRTNGDKQLGVSGVTPGKYTNVLDVVLAADPYVNAAGGDFTLNRAPTGGLLLRGTATPGALPGVSQLGYIDFGCFQGPSASGPLLGGSLVR